MPIKHIRVDDRLIHGQVLIGWGSRYHYDTYIICDEELVKSDWEKEMYLAAVPADTIGLVLEPNQIKEYVDNNPDAKIMLLLKSPRSLEKLVNSGFMIKEVILGGVHDKANRKHIYNFLYLSDEEKTILSALIKKGLHIVCQDLPDHASHELAPFLN